MPDHAPDHADVTRQPLPQAFEHKRSIFDRLQSMAIEMQRARRQMGYVWLEGGMSAMEGSDAVRVHARQSGLILVSLARPSVNLHMEATVGATAPRLAQFHRALDTARQVEYVWDEAMFATEQR